MIKTITLRDFRHNLTREMNTFADLLVSKGFTVYTTVYTSSKLPNNYFSFSKGGAFGYVQSGRDGTSFSSQYVGSREHGTGARYTEGNWAELNLSNAKGCLNFTIGNATGIKFHTEKSFCSGVYGASKMINDGEV